jgi:hypothetical protein
VQTVVPWCLRTWETFVGLFSPHRTTWWLIPLSKWVITPVTSGLTLLIPFIIGVITHLLSGMSHQVLDLFIQTTGSWFVVYHPTSGGQPSPGTWGKSDRSCKALCHSSPAKWRAMSMFLAGAASYGSMAFLWLFYGSMAFLWLFYGFSYVICKWAWAETLWSMIRSYFLSRSSDIKLRSS